ncbi:MAG: epimerase [Phycisphaerae bacterium]
MSTEAPQRVVLAGGSGFLGTGLATALSREQRFEPVILTRSPRQVGGQAGGRAGGRAGGPAGGGFRQVAWDARTPGAWVRELEGAAAVVNLVGRSVDCRKTPANKRLILESRVDSVRALAAGLKQVERPPAVWVQSGTAHIYGDTDDELLDESSPFGTGLAPDVGRAWEAALAEADAPGTRKVVLRISFVLGRDGPAGGGALATLARLTRFGLGGTVGHGRQYISWLHEADLQAMVLRAIDDPSMAGAYVATAPNPVTNRDFMAELRRALSRPWSPPAPAPLVRFGSWLLRTDPELALLGRRCVPTRLMNEGFKFAFPELRGALQDLLTAPAGRAGGADGGGDGDGDIGGDGDGGGEAGRPAGPKPLDE